MEAVDFLRKADAQDQLAGLRAEAIAEGDAFLLRLLAEAMSKPVGRDEWQALARAAEASGRERYAAEARRHFERGEE